MDYCGEHGIPHSRFLAWDPDDQDKAIAWELRRRSRCGSCGTSPDDWLDEEGREMLPPPFVAESIRCYGCGAISEAQADVPEDRRDQYHIVLRPNRDQQ